MFDFRRITLFCLEKRLSKHKKTIFYKTLGGMAPWAHPWLRLCHAPLKYFSFVSRPHEFKSVVTVNVFLGKFITFFYFKVL